MSTTGQTQTYPCQHSGCESEFKPHTAVHGSFCSSECYYRKLGSDAINRIASLHDWCSTCFRPLKDVMSKQELEDVLEHDLDDNVVGVQYPTTTTETGVTDERTVDTVGTEVWDINSPQPAYEPDWQTTDLSIAHGRWGCECGIVDPSTRSEAIRDANVQLIVESLWTCLVRLARKGALNHRPDKTAYFDALREHWRDWEYATGRALHSGD